MAVADHQQELAAARTPAEPAASLWRSEDEIVWTRRPRRQFLVLGLMILLLAALAAGWLGLRHVEQRLEGEILPFSDAIGTSLVQQFEVALSAGIPFEELAGVEPFLATAAGFDERIGFAALFDASGLLRHAAGPQAVQLPQQLETTAQEGTVLRLSDQLGALAGVHLEGELQGYVLVGLEAGLPAQAARTYFLATLLILLAVGILLRELFAGILFQALERPALALAHLARAVESGDLSRTTWLSAPGRLGLMIESFRERLVSVNGRFHAFLLSAFATRAGHFDPIVLREVTEVVRRCLANYRLPPVAGAWPVALDTTGLFRLAAFTLLLGEALLGPAWRLLPPLEPLMALSRLAFVLLPLLLALPLGSETARRLLVGFTDGLVFTAGALIAAAAALALPLVETVEGLLALRLLSGFGLGIALSPLSARGVLPIALAMAVAVGSGPSLLTLFIVEPPFISALAALIMATAGLLVGQMLPARDEAEAVEPASRHLSRSTLLPAAALAAAAPAWPLLTPLSDMAQGNIALLLCLSLGLAAAALAGDWLGRRRQSPYILAALATAAALLFALTVFLPQEGLFRFTLPAALLLLAVVFLGPRPSSGQNLAATALAASVAFLVSLLLAWWLGPARALLLPALLLFFYASSWRQP